MPEGARFVHGDIRDAHAVADALRDVDCVFHLAAQVAIRGSFERFYEDLDTNVMGTARLLKALDPTRVKWLTLASSMAVYAAVALRRRQVDGRSHLPPDPWHARHPVHGRPVLQHLWPRTDDDAVCGRHYDLYHASAPGRGHHDLRRWRAAARLHPRGRHRRRNHGHAGPAARRALAFSPTRTLEHDLDEVITTVRKRL